MAHYSVDRAVIPKRPPEQRNIATIFIPNEKDACYLRTTSPNSDILVYDANTMKPLRKETPSGEVIERY